MKVWIKGAGAVDLSKSDFVASGGEGSIYAKGSTAYKLYTDPSRMVPVDKIRELSVISASNVIKPEQVVVDKLGKPLGYTMRFVRDTEPLCRLFPRTYRDRHGITPGTTLELVQKLQRGVQAVHETGVLVVDLNEMNFLVSKAFDEVYFIDVDSYQTPHYPATALMASVRDWTVQNNDWTELSDWFSFAVVAFTLFTGIHPYKGKHPTLKGFEDRMKAHASVFSPDVKVPKAAYPVDVIPDAYRGWLRAVLEDGKRLPPPGGLVHAVMVAPVVRVVQGTNNLAISELFDYLAQIRGYVEHEGRSVAWTDDAVWVDSRRVHALVGGIKGVGFAPRSGDPVLAGRSVSESKLKLFDAVRKTDLALDLRADDLMSYSGTIYVRNRSRILRVVLSDVGNRVVASTLPASTCLEHATSMFEGVVIQSLLGRTFATVFPQAGHTYQIPIPELDAYKIVEAKFDDGVLMVVGVEQGRYDRLILRFDGGFTSYDMRVVSDINPVGLNFVTLPTGICVCIDEDERLEVFSKRKGSSGLKQVDDPVVGADLRLLKRGGQVVFPRGSKLQSLSMR